MFCPQCGAGNPEDARFCSACGRDVGGLTATAQRPAVDGGATEVSQSTAASGRGSHGSVRPEPHRSDPSRPIAPGIDLGHRYQIIRQLGEGGMGEVYLARDRELDRNVALKVIRGNLTAHEVILERFKREIQLSSTVTHKNILRVYDLGEADGVKFLTMEYIAGSDLASVMRRDSPLPLPRVIDIFHQICEGLQAAHEKNVIHRDLKPQNILVDEKGRVAIADFGLAKSFDYTSLTEAGKVLGTPHYMSPEQVKGIELDQRSDIYSLAIILYEMLTGTVPFTGSSAYEIMVQRTQRPPRPASDHNPKIPPYLLKILDKCLQVDPKLRYASVAEILRDLDTQTFHTSLPYAMRRRARLSAAAAVIAGVVLVAAGIVGWRTLRTTPVQTTEAAHKPVSVLVADVDNKTGDAVFDGTLEPVVTLALEGAPFINAYSRVAAHKAAAQIQPNSSALDERLARLVATREGVNVVVAGAITKGDSYHLALRAIDGVTGKPIGQTDVTANTKDQVLGAVGRAATDLRQALGDTTPVSTQLAAAETFTAGSIAAAHEYAVGQDLFFRGKFDEAARHYEQAVKLDPNLGRAYAGLAASYNNMGRTTDAVGEYKLAMSHIDRMTDREKYRTRATYYLVTHDNGRAVEELNQLVTQYPADMAGLNNLALAYFYQRNMAKALDASEKPIALYPKNVVGRANAALYAMYAGNFDKVKSQADAVLQLNPKYEKAYVAIALSQLASGDVNGATATYQKLAAMSPRGDSMATMGLADIALYQGRTADAVNALKPAVDRDLAAKRNDAANEKLGTLAEAGAERDAAQKIANDPAAALDPHALFTASRALIATKDDAAVSRMASQLDAQIEPELQMYGKLIEGELLLARGNAREALKRFEAARSLADSWLAHYDRGRAYLELSAFTDAYADFDACKRRRGEATAVFLDDVPTYHDFAPVLYYLGRAQQGLNSPAAADSYKQFLAIKTNGDGDPLVADARRRLASSR